MLAGLCAWPWACAQAASPLRVEPEVVRYPGYTMTRNARRFQPLQMDALHTAALPRERGLRERLIEGEDYASRSGPSRPPAHAVSMMGAAPPPVAPAAPQARNVGERTLDDMFDVLQSMPGEESDTAPTPGEAERATPAREREQAVDAAAASVGGWGWLAREAAAARAYDAARREDAGTPAMRDEERMIRGESALGGEGFAQLPADGQDADGASDSLVRDLLGQGSMPELDMPAGLAGLRAEHALDAPVRLWSRETGSMADMRAAAGGRSALEDGGLRGVGAMVEDGRVALPGVAEPWRDSALLPSFDDVNRRDALPGYRLDPAARDDAWRGYGLERSDGLGRVTRGEEPQDETRSAPRDRSRLNLTPLE